MDLPVLPPVAPMLAKSVKELPHGSLSFEPKWDGFRSIVFRDGDEVEFGSRNERPLTRYFPELVEAARRSLPERCVVDGEIVIPDAERRGSTSRPCSSGFIRPTAGSGSSPSRRPPSSSPSTCSRSPGPATWRPSSRSGVPCLSRP